MDSATILPIGARCSFGLLAGTELVSVSLNIMPAPSGPTCAITKDFVSTAPSDIVQQKFEARFDRPLKRVECKDNGLCYQKWGKNCTKATN